MSNIPDAATVMTNAEIVMSTLMDKIEGGKDEEGLYSSQFLVLRDLLENGENRLGSHYHATAHYFCLNTLCSLQEYQQ